MKFTEIDVLAERPAEAPAGWLVFNAPRPIYGAVTWQGVFLHGIFYAAVDPADGEYSRQYMEANGKFDAYLIRYIDMTDVESWLTAHCIEKGYDRSVMDRGSEWAYYHCHVGKREVEI